MENHRKNIDDLFKGKLGSYTEVPPPAVWDALEKRLDGKQKRRGFPWYWSFLLVSFIVLLGGVVWEMTNKQGTAPAMPASENTAAKNEPAIHSDSNIHATEPVQVNEKTNSNESSADNNINNKRTNLKIHHDIAQTNITNTDQNDDAKNLPPNTDNKYANKESVTSNSSINDANNKGPKAGSEKLNNENAVLENILTKKEEQKTPETNIEHIPLRGIEAKKTTPKNIYHGSAPKYVAKEAAYETQPIPTENDIEHLELNKIEARQTAIKNTINSTPRYVAKEAAHETNPGPIGNDIEHVELSKIDTKETSIKNTFSSPPAPYVAKEAVHETKEIPAEKVETQIAGTFKEDNAVSLKDNAINNSVNGNGNNGKPDTASILSNFSRYEEGIKAGYEQGFSNNASKKFVFSTYVQYSLNPKFAIMLQPALKVSNIGNTPLNGTQSFYKKNTDGSYVFADSTPVYVIVGQGIVDTLWKRDYNYSQTHDSIAKSYATGGTYVEVELPLLLKYNISSKLSVYGGVNITYGKMVGITENTYTSGPILKTGSSPTLANIHQSAPQPTSIDSVITYSGNPISSYSGPLYSTQGYLLRFGYMLGFSYEFRKRWLFDVLIQQSTAKSYVQGGYDINNPLTLPYFRLTLGYKLGNYPIHLFKQ